MRALALALLALTTLLPPAASAQETLNKCIDAQGKVTYTNQPCKNAREVRKVSIDPPPASGGVRIEAQKAAPAKPAPAPAPTKLELDTQRVSGNGNGKSTARAPSSHQCDSLSERLGRVIDKMDQGRRQGYSQDQMNEWNTEVRELERKKRDAGCF